VKKSPRPFFLRLVWTVSTMLLVGWVAPAEATQKSAEEEVNRITDNLLRQKVSVIERHGGLLHLGESRTFNVFLDKGKTYYFIVGGCKDAIDLDVGVGDDTGMLKVDQTTDRMAFVEFTAPESKSYVVTAKMAASAPDGAHFSLLICRPPEQTTTFEASNVATSTPAPSAPAPAPTPVPQSTPKPSGTNPPSSSSPSTTPAPAESFVVDLDTKVGMEDGGTATLRSLMGDSKAMYIRVWSSWCGFCKQLDPNLNYRANTLRGAKVKVIALNAFEKGQADKGSAAAVSEARKENKIPTSVPIVIQLEPQKFTAPLRVNSVPRTVLIDRYGKVLFNGHPLDSNLVAALLELGVSNFDLRAGL